MSSVVSTYSASRRCRDNNTTEARSSTRPQAMYVLYLDQTMDDSERQMLFLDQFYLEQKFFSINILMFSGWFLLFFATARFTLPSLCDMIFPFDAGKRSSSVATILIVGTRIDPSMSFTPDSEVSCQTLTTALISSSQQRQVNLWFIFSLKRGRSRGLLLWMVLSAIWLLTHSSDILHSISIPWRDNISAYFLSRSRFSISSENNGRIHNQQRQQIRSSPKDNVLLLKFLHRKSLVLLRRQEAEDWFGKTKTLGENISRKTRKYIVWLSPCLSPQTALVRFDRQSKPTRRNEGFRLFFISEIRSKSTGEVFSLVEESCRLVIDIARMNLFGILHGADCFVPLVDLISVLPINHDSFITLIDRSRTAHQSSPMQSNEFDTFEQDALKLKGKKFFGRWWWWWSSPSSPRHDRSNSLENRKSIF